MVILFLPFYSSSVLCPLFFSIYQCRSVSKMPLNTSFSPQYLASHARCTLSKGLKGSKGHWYALLLCSRLGHSQTRCTGLHSLVPCQRDDSSSSTSTSSGSSSSSESYLSTPPPSPRPARRKLFRKRATSDGFNLYRSYVLANHLLPSETHPSNVSAEVNKRWRNLPPAARQYFEREAEMQRKEAAADLRDTEVMDVYEEDHWHARRAYCYAMDGITDLFQSMSFDEVSSMPSSPAPEDEEMVQVIPDNYNAPIPPTPLVRSSYCEALCYQS